MRYRRIMIAGGTYFFTVVTYHRRKLFSQPEIIDLLLNVMEYVRQRNPFITIAQVILPDHIHSIWELTSDDRDYPKRWRLIKTGFTKQLPAADDLSISASRQSKKERTIWQRRYWEHTIQDETDLDRHIDYIHFNPVNHGLAKYPHEWKDSTFLRFVEEGYYPMDWATSDIFKGIGGE
jgi:putative transposase